MRLLLFSLCGAVLAASGFQILRKIPSNGCGAVWKNSKNVGAASEWRFYESICQLYENGRCPDYYSKFRCCNNSDCPHGVCGCSSGCPYLVCKLAGLCPDLTLPEHGELVKNGYGRYKLNCDNGREKMILTPLGSSGELYCDRLRWNGANHRCRGRCGSPPVVNHARLENTHVLLEDEVGKYGYGGLRLQYSCKKGYRLIGHSEYVCNDDKMDHPIWHGYFECRRVHCRRLPRVDHATENPRRRKYNFNEIVRYSCKVGFRLKGEATLKCDDKGNGKMEWTAPVPRCLPKPCLFRDLKSPKASFTLKPLKNGDVANDATFNVSCQSHYQIVGERTIRCVLGAFHDVDSTGRVVGKSATSKCKPPCCSTGQLNFTELVMVSSVPCGRSTFDSINVSCASKCDEVTNPKAHCRALKDNPREVGWSAVPQCRSYVCDEPSAFEHTAVIRRSSRSTYQCGDVIRYSCSGIQHLVGPPARRCLPRGVWNTTKAVHCVNATQMELMCPSLVPSPNLIISADGRKAGESVSFSCLDCFAADNKRQIECVFDITSMKARWNGSMPTCQPDNCPPLTPPPHMAISSENSTTCGSNVSVSCQPGFLAVDVNGQEFSAELQFVCQGQSHAKPWKRVASPFSHCKKKINCQEGSCSNGEECNAAWTLCVCKRESSCRVVPNGDVCASDGRTYPTECHVHVQNCKQKTNMTVVHNGKCTHGGSCWETSMQNMHCDKSRPSFNLPIHYTYDYSVTTTSASGQCKGYSHDSACDGHIQEVENTFQCKATCQRECSARVCTLPMDQGPCNATTDRWFYNKNSQKCQKFSYSGCGGNQNNFETEQKCKQVAYSLFNCRTRTSSMCTSCLNKDLSRFCNQPMSPQHMIAYVEVRHVFKGIRNRTEFIVQIREVFAAKFRSLYNLRKTEVVMIVEHLCTDCWDPSKRFKGIIAVSVMSRKSNNGLFELRLQRNVVALDKCEYPNQGKQMEKLVCQQCTGLGGSAVCEQA